MFHQIHPRRWKSFFSAFALLATLSLSNAAQAKQYEVFIDIDSEEGINDLAVAGVIGQETADSLVDLLQRGLDLNKAPRKILYVLPNLTYAEVDAILAYRDEVGYIDDPASLVIQNILSEQKLAAISAFLVVGHGRDAGLPVGGMARFQTRYSVEDSGLPASALQVRGQGLKKLRVGLAALNKRQEIGNIRYDPARNALAADAPENKATLPKFYVHWDDDKYQAIAGTYRIGFGQSLTFDNTDQGEPDGFYGEIDVFRGVNLTRDCKESTGELDASPCPAAEGYTYVTPDYRTRDGLMGAAFSLRQQKMGPGMLEAHAFASYQPRNIYQYELYNRATCDDPRSDDPMCSAPDVYRRQSNPLDPSPEFSFQTLNNLYAEKLAGANINYSMSRRTRFGITGYGANVDWLVNGIDLDFQEWSSLPYGGGFGAIGAHASRGFGNTDVFVEATRSFDSMPSGGGFGAIARSVTAWDKNEVEASLRYYDKDFANPHARPISAPDEFEGLRARDEVGGRVQYTGEFDKRLRIRSNIDYWQQLSEDTKEILAFVRGDLVMNDFVTWGLWAQYQDKNLSRSGRDECFVGDDNDVIGPNGPVSCAGERRRLTGRVRLSPNKTTWVDLQYQHELQDDDRYDNKFRQDSAFVAVVTSKPIPKLRLRARTRFLYEDISDSTYLEKSLWSYLDVGYRLRQRDRVRFRYDLVLHLDDRESTENRKPNPEHWVRVEYEARF